MISVIIPAKNEAKGLGLILPDIRERHPDFEIIVIDDASTDDTALVATQFGALVISQPYSKGNGAAIKAGVRAAKGDVVVCMDADGQHMPEDIAKLLVGIEKGFDLVVGARSADGQSNFHRSIANRFYNWFAGWVVGQKIEDLTSGFRALKLDKFKEFIHLLPNKFSYPTTITMSFFRAGYSVAYVGVNVKNRLAGTASHISIMRDGVRFLLIIFKIGTLYSPLKIFLPISLGFFLSGLVYYVYTFIETGRFTNMSALMLSTSILIFLIGLVSEQITNLMYKKD
jgi:glycosyltransferase involved in cell wall biosynthesis